MKRPLCHPERERGIWVAGGLKSLRRKGIRATQPPDSFHEKANLCQAAVAAFPAICLLRSGATPQASIRTVGRPSLGPVHNGVHPVGLDNLAPDLEGQGIRRRSPDGGISLST